jgi:undecaprenyl-phosphate galactose phosphotransferase/putative colanic acid biosynthesis UDP-glucose lipid carrier transferase
MSGAKFGYSKYLPLIGVAADLVVVNVVFFVSHFFRFGSSNWWPDENDSELWFLVNFIWVVIAFYHKAYTFLRGESFEEMLRKLTGYHFIYSATVFLFLFTLNLDTIARLWVLYYIVTSFVFFIFFRWIFQTFFSWYRSKGYNFRRVVLVGDDNSVQYLFKTMRDDITLGFRVLGFFSEDDPAGRQRMVHLGCTDLGFLVGLKDYLVNNDVHEVYWQLTPLEHPLLKDIVQYCENNLIRVKFIPYFGSTLLGRKPIIDMFRLMPLVSLRSEPLQRPINRALKRSFDVVFSMLVLLSLMPILLPILMILIRLGSKGPIFFKQLRTGEDGRSFLCYKFRTMRVNDEADALQATKDDPRLTKIGGFLRRSNLDELPQFWNVLKGEMSVVGPRPHMLKHTEEYSQRVSKFLVRHLAKPGITGWAQVNGLRGETKELIQMEQRVEADIWYVENWSLTLDIRIVIKTIWNMLMGEEKAY